MKKQLKKKKGKKKTFQISRHEEAKKLILLKCASIFRFHRRYK